MNSKGILIWFNMVIIAKYCDIKSMFFVLFNSCQCDLQSKGIHSENALNYLESKAAHIPTPFIRDTTELLYTLSTVHEIVAHDNLREVESQTP